jgi:hypothetical protein
MEWSNIALSGRSADFIEANPESDSISPLPRDFREGLTALSFILSSTLWIYLTYKLITWRLRVRARARRLARNMPEPSVIPNLHFAEDAAAAAAHERNMQQLREAKSEAPNQFLVLIYNLFLAEMHQSGAFVQSASWLRKDGIFIHESTCFIQGYLDSNGDLASSCFISFIAIHTYLSIVRGYQPPQKILYLFIILVWVLVYSLSSIPLIVTKNGQAVGGFFVRAGAWVSTVTHDKSTSATRNTPMLTNLPYSAGSAAHTANCDSPLTTSSSSYPSSSRASSTSPSSSTSAANPSATT